MGSFFTNWKTTLAGLAAGGFNLFANGMKWQQVLVSVGMVAIGTLAKDMNVTGGSVAQTPEATSRTETVSVQK